jgi:chromosome partitioning protein
MSAWHHDIMAPSRFRVLALAAQKGGVGKSTLAVHLAVEAAAHGERVVVVDTDEQESAAGWGERRASETPLVVKAPPLRLPDVLEQAREEGLTLAVVDTAPRAALSAAQIAAAADLVLVPVRASAFDLRTLEAAVAIATRGRRAAFVINAARPRSPEVADTEEVLAHFRLPVAPEPVGDRVAFGRAIPQGLAVSEFEPDGKAAAEIAALWTFVRGLLDGDEADGRTEGVRGAESGAARQHPTGTSTG